MAPWMKTRLNLELLVVKNKDFGETHRQEALSQIDSKHNDAKMKYFWILIGV
jgi:hypothetical protein